MPRRACWSKLTAPGDLTVHMRQCGVSAVAAAISWRTTSDHPMIRQEIRVPEDPIAQGEIAALTRRFEEVAQTTEREFGIVKSDLTALRLQVGNLDQKTGNLDAKVDSLTGEVRVLSEKIDRNQAQIVELLTRLVGRDPDAS
ncbi:hypothetical protein ACH4YN_33365 [Streptomyces griseofuscus]|uniref:hypothetical protein n=1 Tax=Streptomyces griseofuscus TaxID=146922 RepID=UPI0037BC5057